MVIGGILEVMTALATRWEPEQEVGYGTKGPTPPPEASEGVHAAAEDPAPNATKRRISRFVTNRLVNPVVRPLLAAGLFPRTQALLETTGRRSGWPRQVPVGNGLREDKFWIVTEHGWSANYVKNIEQNPRVRVKVGRRWYEGRATVTSDNPEAKLQELGRPVNDTLLRIVGTQKLVIRVDLDEKA